MIGKYLLDFKEFSHATDGHFNRVDADINQRVTKAEY